MEPPALPPEDASDGPASGAPTPDVEARLARLEARVDRLVDVVKALHDRQAPASGRRPPRRTTRTAARATREGGASSSTPSTPGASTASPPSADESLLDEVRSRAAFVFRSEDWLNRLGIGLLLIGLAFLFRYSIEQGWVGPLVRVGFGGALGAGLLALGLRLRPRRLRYGQALMGAGLAVLYTTLFAAFQLYALLSYPVAFAAMCGVTLLGFVLAYRCGDVVTAVVATQGGLSTPFLLYTGAGDLAALVVYTCLLLTCALALFALRGWRTLLATAVVGGWLVLGFGRVELLDLFGSTLRDGRHFTMLLGAVYAGLLFGGVPLARAVAHHRDPARWPRPPLVWFRTQAWAQEPARLLAVAVPLVTWAFVADLFGAPDWGRGALLLGAAAGYGALLGWLRGRGLPALGSAHGVAAALLAALSAFYLFDGDEGQLVAVALVVAGTHLAARRLADGGLRATAHGLAALVLLVVAVRLERSHAPPPFVTARALADAAALGLLATAAATLKAGRGRTAYLLATYVLALGWLARELAPLANGQALVSVAWAACALGLLALGWRRRSEFVRRAGLATLLVVVAKLFVVDLAALNAVWRILIFLGFGALLMLVSYLVPSLWRSDDETPA